MSEFNQNRSPALPLFSSVSKELAKQRQVSTIEQSGKLQKNTSSTKHRAELGCVQQPQSRLSHQRSMQQMQYRLLILIYLLFGLSTVSLVLGVVNWFTLHSLQEKVQQRL